MTTTAIGQRLDVWFRDLEGGGAFCREMGDEVRNFVLSNDSGERMRITAPMGELKDLQVVRLVEHAVSSYAPSDLEVEAGYARAAAGDGGGETRRQ